MNTASVATLATVLPALAVIQEHAPRTTRNGKCIRIRRYTALNQRIVDAVKALVEAGIPVRLMMGNVIVTPTMVDGTIIFPTRSTKKFRPFLVTEVQLG